MKFATIATPSRFEERAAHITAWITERYWLAVLPALAIIILRCFIPEYLSNEPVRLISLRQFVNPSFPAPDWLQAAGYSEDRLTLAFKALLSPLWFFTKQGIVAALAGRLIVWTSALFALLRLAQAMGVKQYALALGLLLWIGLGQSLGASEWIFWGVEGKCLAYTSLMLALDAVLRRRIILAAVFCGLSLWFHVPVGLWGTLAIGGALLLCLRDLGIKRLLQFAAITAALLVPMALIALAYTGTSGLAGAYPYADWLIVVFRAPHHLDPNYFGGVHELLKALLCAAFTVVGLNTITSRFKVNFLGSFLLMLLIEFGSGLVARKLGLFWYLKTYPFRVADVLVPLLFWLVLPGFVVALVSRFYPKTLRLGPGWRTAAGMLLLVSAIHIFGNKIQAARARMHFFAHSWAQYLRHTETPYHEMTQWIRTSTPRSAVFIAPPWKEDFWLEAERAEVVDLKRVPHNHLIIEWYRRYTAVNGGPYHSAGYASINEVQRNYPRLSQEQLDEIHKLYGAQYYLTPERRDDLQTQLAHENGTFYLYSFQ